MTDSTPPTSQSTQSTTTRSAATHYQQRLRVVWWAWLLYRSMGVVALSHWLLVSQPNMSGGITWQMLWLLPVLLATPWILQGNRPYALLLISMLTLLYWGGSGMLLLNYVLMQQWALSGIWLVDFGLLTLINLWLFLLLKRLPKMHNPTADNE